MSAGCTCLPHLQNLTVNYRSISPKKDRILMEEESKLLDKYYKDYYNTPPKNGSHDSRDSSTDERHVQYADPHNVSPTQLS